MLTLDGILLCRVYCVIDVRLTCPPSVAAQPWLLLPLRLWDRLAVPCDPPHRWAGQVLTGDLCP